MKTTLQPYHYSAEREIKRPRLERREYYLPLELWKEVIYQSVRHHGDEPGERFAELHTVCKAWNELCDQVKILLCQEVAFDTLFQLPIEKSLAKCERTFFEYYCAEENLDPDNEADLNYINNSTISDGWWVSNSLAKNSKHFLELHGNKLSYLNLIYPISDKLLSEMLVYMSNIKNLSLSLTVDSQLPLICQFSQLTALEIDPWGVSDKAFEGITKLQNLELLSLKENGLDLSVVSKLTNLTSLKILSEIENVFPNLLFLHNLQSLTYGGGGHPLMWNQLSHLTNLTELQLAPYRYVNPESNQRISLHEHATKFLSQFTRLRVLSLRLSESYHLTYLSSLTNLTSLTVRFSNEMELDNLLPISHKLTNLTSLSMLSDNGYR